MQGTEGIDFFEVVSIGYFYYLRTNFCYGTAKEEYRRLLAIVFRLRGLLCLGLCRTLQLFDPHPSLSLHLLCQGDGYHVIKT